MQTKSYPHRGTKGGGGRLVLMKPLPIVIDKLGACIEKILPLVESL